MTLTQNSNILTTGSLDSFIQQTADRNFQDKRFFAQFATQHNKPTGATSVTIYQPKNMDGANATLTEGVTPSATAFDLTPVVITLTQIGARVELSDIVLSDSPIEPIKEAAWELGQDLARKEDKMAQDTLDAGSNVTYSIIEDASAGRTNIDDGDIISINYIAAAAAELAANNVPTFDGFYVCILHPRVAYDLKLATGATNWLPVNAYQNSMKIFKGELGSMYGVRFIESSNVQFYANASDGAGSTGTVDVYPTYVFGDRCFHQATDGDMQTYYRPLGYGEDALAQRAQIGTKFRTGFKIGREAGIRRIESSSSIGTNT